MRSSHTFPGWHFRGLNHAHQYIYICCLRCYPIVELGLPVIVSHQLNHHWSNLLPLNWADEPPHTSHRGRSITKPSVRHQYPRPATSPSPLRQQRYRENISNASVAADTNTTACYYADYPQNYGLPFGPTLSVEMRPASL